MVWKASTWSNVLTTSSLGGQRGPSRINVALLDLLSSQQA